MSAPLRTTNEAEGLPRRRFTFDEVERMVRLGVLAEDERIELIGGEIVPMSPKGPPHERLKTALTFYWAKACPPGVLFTQETTFRLSRDTYVEPDFTFYPTAGGWSGLAPETALLVVELSDSSYDYDIGRKARLYARFGIAELWVVHAPSRSTRIHRGPGPGGWSDVADRSADERLVPACSAELAVTMADLNLH